MALDYAAFASVFANNLVIIMSGAVCAWTGLSRFFDLRRADSAVIFWVFFTVKCSLWAFFDTAAFFGIDGTALRAFSSITVAVLSVATYIAIYIVWRASLLQIGLVSILVDSVAGFCTVIVLALFGWLTGGAGTLSYAGFFGANTAIIAAGQIALFLVAVRAVEPVGRFAARLKPKHESVWQTLLAIFIVVVASQKTSGVDNALASYALVSFIVILAFPAIALRVREVRRRRLALARASSLMRVYGDSMRNQAEFLAESRALLDEMAQRIAVSDAALASGDVLPHLRELRAVCDRLRFGVYSDCPALDVALVSYEGRFLEIGVRVVYRISPLSEGEQAAVAVQALLEWAYQACSEEALDTRPGRRKARDAGAGDAPPAVELRVFQRANQLLVEMRAPVGDGRPFRGSWVAERMRTPACSVRDTQDGGSRVVRIIAEEARPWIS